MKRLRKSQAEREKVQRDEATQCLDSRNHIFNAFRAPELELRGGSSIFQHKYQPNPSSYADSLSGSGQ